MSMTTLLRFTGIPKGIPAIEELSARQQWVAWKYATDKNGKITKIPVCARAGFNASHSNPKTWCSFEEAIRYAQSRGIGGVGYVVTDDDEYTGIDLDKCISDDGDIEPWAAAIIAFAETYCEYSPSGRGIRMFVRGKTDKSVGANTSRVEIYRTKRYLTVTGNHVQGTPTDIRSAPKTLEALLKRVDEFRKPIDQPVVAHRPVSFTEFQTSNEEMCELLFSVDPDCPYDDWLSAMMAVHSETGGSASGLDLVDRWSAGGSKYAGRREIETKWHSFKGGGVTIGTLANLARMHGANLSEIAIKYMPMPTLEQQREYEELNARLLEALLKKPAKDKAKKLAEQKKQSTQELEWFDDIQPVIQSPYMVKGFLDNGSMSVVYGPSNSGKTFFALDVAFHVACCPEWRDRRVKGGAVLYLAAEGGNGIANRIAALRQTTGVLDVPFALRRAGLDLLDPKADTENVIRLAAEVAKKQPLALIVIDTLSRVIAGGDENAASDMTAFIKNVDLIRQRTGAHIMIVHHTGKDAAKGARGHSSLRAATDTEIEVMVDEFGNRCAKVTKQRDYEGGEEFGFALKSVHLGHDQDGDAVNTCVVEATEKQEKQAEGLPPIETCRAMLKAIDEAWKAKNPLSTAPQHKHAGRYATRYLARQFDLKQSAVEKLLDYWHDNAVVVTEICDTHTKKRGLKVLVWV